MVNLWFACGSPFTKTTEITKTTKITKTAQTATNKGLSAGIAEITETTKMTKTPGCKPRVPQTTGLEIPDKGEKEVEKLDSRLMTLSFKCKKAKKGSATEV